MHFTHKEGKNADTATADLESWITRYFCAALPVTQHQVTGEQTNTCAVWRHIRIEFLTKKRVDADAHNTYLCADDTAVDTHHAVFELIRHLPHAPQIICVKIRGKTCWPPFHIEVNYQQFHNLNFPLCDYQTVSIFNIQFIQCETIKGRNNECPTTQLPPSAYQPAPAHTRTHWCEEGHKQYVFHSMLPFKEGPKTKLMQKYSERNSEYKASLIHKYPNRHNEKKNTGAVNDNGGLWKKFSVEQCDRSTNAVIMRRVKQDAECTALMYPSLQSMHPPTYT